MGGKAKFGWDSCACSARGAVGDCVADSELSVEWRWKHRRVVYGVAGRVAVRLSTFSGRGVVDPSVVVQLFARVRVVDVFPVDGHVIHAVVDRKLRCVSRVSKLLLCCGANEG